MRNTRRYFMAAAVTAVLFAGMAAQTAFAIGWEMDASGRKYQMQDMNYAHDGWQWIDGSCYYFDASGHVVSNGVTPDGCTVDEAGIWTVDGVRQENPRSAVQLPRYGISVRYFGFIPPVAWEKNYSYQADADGGIVFYDNNGQMLFSVRVLPVEGDETLDGWINVKRIGKLVHNGKTTHAVYRADAPGQGYDAATAPAQAANYAWMKSYEKTVLKSLYGIYSYQYVPSEK